MKNDDREFLEVARMKPKKSFEWVEVGHHTDVANVPGGVVLRTWGGGAAMVFIPGAEVNDDGELVYRKR